MEATKNTNAKQKKAPIDPAAVAEADRKRREEQEKRDVQKADNFVRLTNMRVPKALNMLRIVSNLANRNNYKYSPEQVAKIVDALQKEVDNIRREFSTTEPKANTFVL